MSRIDFDATTVEPSTGRDPIPAGKYVAAIVESELKPTKSGNGQLLEICYQVIEGEHKGRKLWSRHNLVNMSATAVQIAKGELSAICRSCGVLQPKDSCELHNIPLCVSVRVAKRNDSDEMVNEVTSWAKKDAAAGVPQQQTGGAGGTGGTGGATSTPNTPPWQRRS
jgi:hypothetical protein